ncbi:MAG: hypothetical protein J6Y00_02050 [Paludibacteraceae bacterium]|nr:hypothetical protein [Paludibacteraceae bacterium]
MNRHFVFILCLVAVLTACQPFQKRNRSGIIAEVEGQTLTQEDIARLTAGMAPGDSARVAEQYIQDWAISILQYEKASAAGSERIEQLVADYRRRLYREAYEQMLVRKYMPKQIDDSLVARFYAEHQQQFVLRESIVKGILVVLPQGAPGQDKLRKWLASPQDELENIEKYAYRYAAGYELFLDTWKTANQLLLRLPVDARTLQTELRKDRLIELGDSAQVCFLKVTDRHFAQDPMPLDYADADIRNILLKQREISFLQQQRHELYEEAVRSKKILRTESR